MSLNLYSLIIEACNNNNVDVNLEQISKINDTINDLVVRGINPDWIKSNLEVLI